MKCNCKHHRGTLSNVTAFAWLLLLLLCMCAVAKDGQTTTDHTAEKRVTFYHAYGYLHDQEWMIPMRLWVHEEPAPAQRALAKAARRVVARRAGLVDLSDAQIALFERHSDDFFADSESGETVRFRFDDDPEREEFVLANAEGKTTTDRNGLLEGVLRLDPRAAGRLLKAQGSTQGWLRFRAISDDHQGIGFVRLIPPEGLSVISDIDDTIKVTEIPAGEREVLMNTFFREFVAAPCMAEIYQGFGDNVAFHYVSGGPWQMYRPLDEFLFADPDAFPLGSFHMKNLRANPFEKDSYKDIWNIIANGAQQATFDQKLSQISSIMNHFPGRSFILIGDSGERDPEVFKRIREDFPAQIRDIVIRVVTDEGATGSDRLDNMIRVAPHESGTSCNEFAKAAAP